MHGLGCNLQINFTNTIANPCHDQVWCSIVMERKPHSPPKLNGHVICSTLIFRFYFVVAQIAEIQTETHGEDEVKTSCPQIFHIQNTEHHVMFCNSILYSIF